MKRLLILFFMAFGLIGAMFAKIIEIPISDIPDVSNGWIFASIAALASAVVFVTEAFKKVIKVSGGVAQLISWLVSIILAFLGQLLDFGMFGATTWQMTLAIGIGTGLVANGVFDVSFVKQLLQALFKEKANS